MAEPQLIREPIGLRVLVRALRPDDREPFTLWRAEPQVETEALRQQSKQGSNMVPIARLQAYLRYSASQVYEAVPLPPFTLFLHRTYSSPHRNYAIPDQAVGKEQMQALVELEKAFTGRDRQPRFEFIEEFAPELPAVLRAAGWSEEHRGPLMICTPDSYRAAQPVAGLTIVEVSSTSPIVDVLENMDVNGRGFYAQATPPTEAEAEEFRRILTTSRAFTARLHGEPVGAGAFTVPHDGLTEIVGIATLEEYRRRGIASALTAHATRAAFSMGVDVAFLGAADVQASRVYEHVGFRRVATILAYSLSVPGAQE